LISEAGKVVAIEPQGLWVETFRKTTCGSCEARQGCGHGIMSSMGGGNRTYTWVLLGEASADDYNLHDEVEIAIPENAVLSGSFVVYGAPLLCMILGAGLSQLLLSGVLGADLSAVLGAVSGFVGGVLLVRWHAVVNRTNPDYQPVLLPRSPSVRLI
jgi:sigma-E factor negative regulatory protein RseC